MTLQLATTAKLHHATHAKAERLAQALEADYPALHLSASYNEDESQVVGWFVVHTEIAGPDTDGNGEPEAETTIYEGTAVPELLDLLDACTDMGLDPEMGADPEDEGPSGSVVPAEYRVMYREMSSNGQSCGDWLAEWLVAQTHGIDGFNVEDFQGIVNANGLDQTAKWAQLPTSGQAGWKGRYRMNGRQALEKVVAFQGFVKTAQGSVVHVPDEDLAILRRKHAKWIAKETKRIEAAKAA